MLRFESYSEFDSLSLSLSERRKLKILQPKLSNYNILPWLFDELWPTNRVQHSYPTLTVWRTLTYQSSSGMLDICTVNMHCMSTMHPWDSSWYLQKWKHILVAHSASHKNLGMLLSTPIFSWLLDTLHFDIVVLARNQHQSHFWKFCGHQTCTRATQQWFNFLILRFWQGLQANLQRLEIFNDFCLLQSRLELYIWVASALPGLWPRMKQNPSFFTSQAFCRGRIYEIHCLMKFSI